MDTIPEHPETENAIESKESQGPQESQTASDFIQRQLELEADAREVLPYKFDSCSKPLGPLRQTVFACLTCSPSPASPAQVYNPAGICYSCSIACHGEHTLVELFARRNFVCDCGTTRIASGSICTLRADSTTGLKGVHSEEAASGNRYNHNFQNKFCGCDEEYDAQMEKGTMYQCLGLGCVENGGCGEDWWHPECLMGLPRDWHQITSPEIAGPAIDGSNDEANAKEHPIPPGFPAEEDFDSIICYKCVESNPWIKPYAGTPGFLPAVFNKSLTSSATGDDQPRGLPNLKRKITTGEENIIEDESSKRMKQESTTESSIPRTTSDAENAPASRKHDLLPSSTSGVFSLFLKEDFREHLCHCPKCYPHLVPHQQLLEEEETYQPSESDSQASDAGPGSGTRSHGTGSLLERGEAALSGVDRVRAIEGVMVYNHLKDKVREFLKPYAESGKAVGAEDIKAYFEKLRGDESAIKEAGSRPVVEAQDDEKDGDHRRKQSGY